MSTQGSVLQTSHQDHGGSGPLRTKKTRVRIERTLPANSEVFVESAGCRIYYKAISEQQARQLLASFVGGRNGGKPISELLAYKDDRVVVIREGSLARDGKDDYRVGSFGEML